MEETLERELSRATRSQKPVGIIMLDVDHFKHINDTNGHYIGDSVLRQLGHFLKEHTRGSDIACRFGGEEFILILPEASLEQTRLCARKLTVPSQPKASVAENSPGDKQYAAICRGIRRVEYLEIAAKRCKKRKPANAVSGRQGCRPLRQVRMPDATTFLPPAAVVS